MKSYLTAPEISEELVSIGVKKATRPLKSMILLGLLAGAYIGFAAHLATTAVTGWYINGEPVFYGVKKLVLGGVFSVGLMLIMICGAELFTGNCLLPVALYKRKISLKSMLGNWGVIWLSNLAGTLLAAWAIAGLSGLLHGEVGKSAISIAAAKCSLTGTEIFVRAILANWIVCLAVMMSMAAKDIGSKILAIFFPIMGFAASGFEHSIANMYFIPAAMLAKAFHPAADPQNAVNLTNAIRNIGIATAGNILGGALLVATAYYHIYLKDNKSPQTAAAADSRESAGVILKKES